MYFYPLQQTSLRTERMFRNLKFVFERRIACVRAHSPSKLFTTHMYVTYRTQECVYIRVADDNCVNVLQVRN